MAIEGPKEKQKTAIKNVEEKVQSYKQMPIRNKYLWKDVQLRERKQFYFLWIIWKYKKDK